MTEDQREKCHLIIHVAAASAAAVGGGMAQLRVADAAVIVPIQITMTGALGAVFDMHLTASAAKEVVLVMVGANFGRLFWLLGFQDDCGR